MAPDEPLQGTLQTQNPLLHTNNDKMLSRACMESQCTLGRINEEANYLQNNNRALYAELGSKLLAGQPCSRATSAVAFQENAVINLLQRINVYVRNIAVQFIDQLKEKLFRVPSAERVLKKDTVENMREVLGGMLVGRLLSFYRRKEDSYLVQLSVRTILIKFLERFMNDWPVRPSTSKHSEILKLHDRIHVNGSSSLLWLGAQSNCLF